MHHPSRRPSSPGAGARAGSPPRPPARRGPVRRAGLVAALAAVATVLGGAVAAPALAEPDLTVDRWPAQASDRNCVVTAEATAPGEQLTDAAPPDVRCFDSTAAALEHVMGEPVTDLAALAGDPVALGRLAAETVRDAKAAEAEAAVAGGATTKAAGDVLLGFSYKDPNYNGAKLTLMGSGSGCWDGATYGFPDLGRYGFNNMQSSIWSFAGCWNTSYDYTGYGGAKLNCTPACASIIALNDKASSIVFRQRYTYG